MAYTLANIGCYVDGARGIYAVDRIIEIAEEHGMTEPELCGDSECFHCAPKHYDEVAAREWNACAFSGEIEDTADEHMNARHGVEGAYWGRNDNGDWGLWPSEDDGA